MMTKVAEKYFKKIQVGLWATKFVKFVTGKSKEKTPFYDPKRLPFPK